MKTTFVLIALLLLSACHKDEQPRPGLPRASPIPLCNYVVSNYSGAIPAGASFVIPIAADPTAFSNDLVAVYICKIADCAVSVPGAHCENVPAGTPCMSAVTYPNSSPNITIQRHQVTLTNASAAGYGSYAILEDACL